MNLLGNILDILTALAAIVAAVLWFKSAVIKTPESFSIHVVKPDMEPMGGNPVGGTYAGQAYSQDLINLANSIRQQSRLSAIAASFAGSSAIIQALSIIIKIYFK